MKPELEQHLAQVAHRFHIELGDKYRKGQESHGGCLLKKGLLFHVENAREEVIDSVVYSDCLREDVKQIHAYVSEALAPNTPDSVLRSYLGDIKRVLEGTDTSGS